MVEARTSLSHPMYLDWLDLRVAPRFANTPGHLGMTILPGKYQPDGMSGKHQRNLELDAARLAELGVQSFVLLVEDWELLRCRVPDFVATLNRHGIEVLRCPIVDRHTPDDRSPAMPSPVSEQTPAPWTSQPGDREAFSATLRELEQRLAKGETVAVSCRGGLGRTGLLAACLLVNGGLEPEAAIAATRAVRHGTIQNPRQETFVHAWSSTH